MADFKDVIIRLQENRNSNVEAIETQTSALSETIVSTAKTQNRSFGQSLALQFKRNTGELSELKSIFTDQVEFADVILISKIDLVQKSDIDKLITIFRFI